MTVNRKTYFTWGEFDKSLEIICNKCQLSNFSGVFGIPRGGLCLAVALSHKLKINLLSEPKTNSLIVDDVYETGFTLKKFRNIEGAMFFVLFSKRKPTWWNTVNLSKENEWIIFPWENKNNTINDQKEYFNKRR